MADNFSDIYIKFAVLGLFVFAIMSFVIIMQQDNDVAHPITENTIINSTFNNLNTDLGKFRDTSESKKQSFEADKPITGFGSLLLLSIVSAGTTFTGLIIGIFNIVILLPSSVLGISPIVTGVLTSLLVTLMIIGLWRLYKLGT